MKIFKEIQKRIFPTIVALSALSVSASAAFYSVTGLSKLFAGATLEVIIMATSLEVAKLVIASLLYQYWDKLNRLLRIYLTLAATILVLITSAGIYGFLSGAYQETATKNGIMEKEISVLELKRERFSETRDNLVIEKKELTENISELRKGLSNNVIQYRDKQTGEIITTTSSSTRKVLDKQLQDAVKRKDIVSKELEQVTDSLTTLDIKILETESGTELSSELGPLKYVSELTGIPMNKVVNYLLLIIIFVFDPLAISLVIGANFVFSNLKNENKFDINEITEEEKIRLSREYGLKEKEIEDEKYTPTDEELKRLEKILDRYETKNETEDEIDEKYLDMFIDEDTWLYEDIEQEKRFLNENDIEVGSIIKKQVDRDDQLLKNTDTTSKLDVLDGEVKSRMGNYDVIVVENNGDTKIENENPPSKNKRLIYAPRGSRNTKIDRI